MQTMNSKALPPFIQQEMDKIAEKIRPLMKKVSLYHMIGLPMLIFGVMNMALPFLSSNFQVESMLIPAIYALVAAVGVALFKESRFLRKQVHLVTINYMKDRIKKSQVFEASEKDRFLRKVSERKTMDLPAFFQFLTEEHKRRQF